MPCHQHLCGWQNRFLPSWELKLRLVQSLIGLRVAALVGAVRREPNALTYLPMHALVLPGCVLCMAWSVVCVGLHRARAWPVGPCAWSHHQPRTAPSEWRQALRVCPTQLFSSATAGVILRNKGTSHLLKPFRCSACPYAADAPFVTACGAWLLPTWEPHLHLVQCWSAQLVTTSGGTVLVGFVRHPLCDQGACFWQAVPACPGFAANDPPRALPRPVHPLVAWRASHLWADLFGPLSCAASLYFLAFVSLLSQSCHLQHD
ncbi:hypothetical protein V6N12_035416 [Hibiscus sabdariffa]|uniref:Uncharacterized protein n=1 Tax=Hibiscus sabdariffa TaxID=183260 RepID=A0ABR2ERJ0_9ROSI